MDQELKARIAECTLNDEDKACIDRCTGELRALIGALGPGWSLKLFGSAANGFGTRSSDIDATCVEDVAPSDEATGLQSAAGVLKDRLAPILREHKSFAVVAEVLTASIPILKLRFEDSIEVDLSCRNTEALQNTRLLRGYADLDGRVRDLGILVKLWAKAANVWGASRRFLSSYSFTLLTIYFMQVHPDVQLPYLPTGSFSEGGKGDGQEKVAAARSIWTCSLSLAELLARFFDFYHTEFQWGSEVVSLRLGRRVWSSDAVFEHLRGRWVERLHIEDPYKLERNLHCVLGPEVEEHELRVAVAEAWNALHLGGMPVGLGRLAASPAQSPLLQPDGGPDLLRMLMQEVDLGEAWGCGLIAEEQEAQAVEERADGAGEASRAPKPRASSWLSPGGDGGTVSGVTTQCESSGTESQASDDERRGAEGALAKWQWWQHLGELDPSAGNPGAAARGIQEAGAAEQRRARWHTIQDLEETLGEAAVSKDTVGVPQATSFSRFASCATGRIASRVSHLFGESVSYQ